MAEGDNDMFSITFQQGDEGDLTATVKCKDSVPETRVFNLTPIRGVGRFGPINIGFDPEFTRNPTINGTRLLPQDKQQAELSFNGHWCGCGDEEVKGLLAFLADTFVAGFIAGRTIG